MESVKILHMADIHIGRKLTSLNPRKANQRSSEVIMTLEDTLDRFDDARIVLLAGDIFEEDCPSSTVEYVASIFGKHKDKRFFLSCGNHDCIECAAIKIFLSVMPDNVYVFPEKTQKVVLDDMNVEVYGASFVAPNMYSSLLSGFAADDSDRIKLMVLHGDVSSQSSFNPISRDDIGISGLNYLALGHIHSFSGMLSKDGVLYAYPGVMEPGGFDETGECGVIYGDISKTESNLSFYPVSRRRYHTKTIDITGLASDDAVLGLIKNEVNEDDLYKITFVGSPDFSAPDLILYEDVTEAFYVEFANRCVDARSIMDYINEDSLRGKTAKALSLLKETYGEDVYEKACNILTALMCKD